jgi:DNA-binding response OmpR family regulator
MDQPDLRGARILILEDDYYLATDVQYALEKAGARVIGPFPSASEALSAIANARLDCALLDINLGHGPDFEALRASGTPFLFVTGYDAPAIPVEFAAARRPEKPVTPEQIATELCALMER